jgi:hypothetical protein
MSNRLALRPFILEGPKGLVQCNVSMARITDPYGSKSSQGKALEGTDTKDRHFPLPEGSNKMLLHRLLKDPWYLWETPCGSKLNLAPAGRRVCCVRLCYFSRRRVSPGVSKFPGKGAGRMRFAGFLLLVAGWLLVLASIVLLGSAPSRSAFVFAGIGVEALGLILVFRSHSVPREEER